MNKEQQELSEGKLQPLNLPPNNHGYPDCDCDLEGGDETCTIQPPYMSGPERWKLALKQRETELVSAFAELDAKDALIASLKAEISKQNKAEDELLATGEKLAEERK